MVSERDDVRQWQHLFKGEACERSQSNVAPTPRIIRETVESTYWLWSCDPVYGCGTSTFHGLRKSTVERGTVGQNTPLVSPPRNITHTNVGRGENTKKNKPPAPSKFVNAYYDVKSPAAFTGSARRLAKEVKGATEHQARE